MAVDVLLVVVLQLPVYGTDADDECNCTLDLCECNARPYRLLLLAWRPSHKVFEHMKKAVKIDRNTVCANIQIMTHRSLCVYLVRTSGASGFRAASRVQVCCTDV